MNAGAELGIFCNLPYISSVDYYNSTASAIENPKFVYFADVFPKIRVISDFTAGTDTYPKNIVTANHTWINALKAHNPSVYILYGSVNNSTFKPRFYNETVTYILEEAVWAEANDVDLFCIGNENLITSVHGTIHGMVATLSRASNVVTATFSFNHGFTTGDYIFVYGATPSNMNIADSESAETVQCTVTGDTTITYPAVGVDGDATGTIYVDWSAKEVVRKTKALAVAVQAVFTRGPVQYSESQGHFTPWIAANITPNTDIDLIGINSYGSGNNEAGYSNWQNEIDTDFTKFGTNLIITEMNVVQEAPDTRKVNNFIYTQKGFDQAATDEILRRYRYAKTLGITQIYLFGPWGNGINWYMSFNFLCNTSPFGWNDVSKRQVVGNLMPVIDRLKGIRVSKVFFGTCTNM